MKIGVLGSGMVAKVLGSGFLSHGHSVMLGTRDSGKLADWQSENPQGQVGSFSATAAFGEVVVLAVKGSVAAQALAQSGAGNLAGKPVIDATNPIADAPPVKGVLQFFTDQNGSLMEDLQAQFPDAHLVKAFNSVGSARMVNPTYAAGKPTMFICGNESAARETVGELVEQFGWEVADMGTAEAARAIEPLCMLWCIPGFKDNQWTHAFKLLK
ncbi:MAG TPA: NAD(P)-binding domain-containing protein [Calditrichia bacterium]|nr:NAD(P)-binding domain-containing protein [Calditrichia bacterium]